MYRDSWRPQEIGEHMVTGTGGQEIKGLLENIPYLVLEKVWYLVMYCTRNRVAREIGGFLQATLLSSFIDPTHQAHIIKSLTFQF